MEKAAAAAPPVTAFTPPESTDRMEDRKKAPIVPVEDKDEEYAEHASLSAQWQSKPSIKDQVERHPDSVRTGTLTTVMLDMKNAKDSALYNEIQAGASSPEFPTMAIIERDVQKHKGSWTILLTYAKIEYLKLN